MNEWLQVILDKLKNPWEYLGFLGTGLYALRVMIQWIASEREKKLVVPIAYWWLSIAAALVTLVYSVVIAAPPIILQNLPNCFFYARNLVLHYRHVNAGAASA